MILQVRQQYASQEVKYRKLLVAVYRTDAEYSAIIGAYFQC